MLKERLPEDPQRANERLAHEVNRLNGQVAALIAYIKALGVEPDTTPDALRRAVEATLPPVLLPAKNAATIGDHASITISELLSKS